MSGNYRAPVRAGIQSGRFPVVDHRGPGREPAHLRPDEGAATRGLRRYLESRGKNPDAYMKQGRR